MGRYVCVSIRPWIEGLCGTENELLYMGLSDCILGFEFLASRALWAEAGRLAQRRNVYTCVNTVRHGGMMWSSNKGIWANTEYLYEGLVRSTKE